MAAHKAETEKANDRVLKPAQALCMYVTSCSVVNPILNHATFFT